MEDFDYNEIFGIEPEPEPETEPSDEPEVTEEEPEDGLEPETEVDDEPTEEPAEDEAPEQESEKEENPEQKQKPFIPSTKPDASPDDAQRVIDEAFRTSGLVNPYTNEAITTKAQYDAYKQRFDAERKATILEKSGMTEDEFNRFVGELPEVKAARERAEQAEREIAAAREADAKRHIDEQMKEISTLDGNIKEFSDLAKMDNYDSFYALVQKGNTLVDAFRLANFDKLTKNAATASTQAALHASRAKSHLKGTKERGSGSVSVPESVKEEYRLFNPDATDAEIERHYKKYSK